MNNSPGETGFLQARSSTILLERYRLRNNASLAKGGEPGPYQRRRAPAIAPMAGATTSQRPIVASSAVP
jgi:hypothetical protein